MFEYDDPRTHGGQYGDWANPEDIVHPHRNPFSGHAPTHDAGHVPEILTHDEALRVTVDEPDPCHAPEHASAHASGHTPLHVGRWAEGKR